MIGIGLVMIEIGLVMIGRGLVVIGIGFVMISPNLHAIWVFLIYESFSGFKARSFKIFFNKNIKTIYPASPEDFS